MHDQESSFSPKLTMPVNFYCHEQSLSNKKIRISNFYFLYELLPFVKESFFFSDENTIIITLAKTFHMI